VKYIDTDAVRASAEAQWRSSEATRAEFGGCKSAFVAYSVADAQGLAPRFRGNVQTHTAAAAPAPASRHAAQPGAGMAQLSQSDVERFRAQLQKRIQARQSADPSTFDAWLAEAEPSEPGTTRRAFFLRSGVPVAFLGKGE
jgi:hypothetical protein